MSNLAPISRVNRSRKAAKTTYNRYSLLYDFISGSFERQYAMTGLRMLDVQSKEYVLEVGFGTGHALVYLAHLVGQNGRVTGIDISERMCGIARQRTEKAGIADRVTIHCKDAMKMPFGAAQFDAIFMSFTLELFDTPDIPRLLKECKRVLKPHGRIVNVSLLKQTDESRIERLYEWVHKLFPQWVDCRPIYGSQALAQADFTILEVKVQPMFGLFVELVLANKSGQ